MINHLFFFPLFLLTPLFFEHQENLSVPLFAPRTPFTLRRGSRQLRPPSLCCYFVHKNQGAWLPMPPLLSGIGCLWTSVAASLRLLAPSPFLKSHQSVNNSPLPLAERGGFFAARNHGCIVCLLASNHGFPSRLGRRVWRELAQALSQSVRLAICERQRRVVYVQVILTNLLIHSAQRR